MKNSHWKKSHYTSEDFELFGSFKRVIHQTLYFSLQRGGVRQKFAEGMLIWWVPKRPVCNFFPWSCKCFPWGFTEKLWSFLGKVLQKWIICHKFRCLYSSKTQKLVKNWISRKTPSITDTDLEIKRSTKRNRVFFDRNVDRSSNFGGKSLHFWKKFGGS